MSLDWRDWFAGKPAALLGLDVGVSAIKLVALDRNAAGVLHVLHADQAPLDPDWIHSGHLAQFDEVAAAVRGLLKRSGTAIRRVAMALPSAAVLTKTIEVPVGLNPASLAEQVQAQARQYLGLEQGGVSVDFGVVDTPSMAFPATASVTPVSTVWLAAARQETVSDWQGLAEAAGLVPVILDVQTHAAHLALTRWIPHWPAVTPDAVIALFELEAPALSLQVVAGDAVLYDRQQRWAHDPAPPPVQDLTHAMQHALQYFFASTTHQRVDGIALTGAWATAPGLVQNVAQQLALPCEVVNPFVGMAYAPTLPVQSLQDKASVYTVAVGLALRRFEHDPRSGS